ncbi:MAG: HIT domain-containing protein [Candidatus Nanoarchaeia archaeon]
MIGQEQAEQIKKQLIGQIENSQLENKDKLKEYIAGLDGEQLEAFLKQNNMLDSQGEESERQENQGQEASANNCVFCSIVQGKIASNVIGENKKALAVLEINPLSRGHAIVIPKQHISTEKIPASVLGLAKKVAAKIKKKLSCLDVKIESFNFQGHSLINLIPIYKDTPLAKKQASKEELEEVRALLEIKKRAKRKSTKESETQNESKSENKSESGLLKILPRIP